MSSLNRVLLMGNLTRDPEVKYLPSGTAITSFDLAINEKYRDRNQQLKEEVLFIRIDTFGKSAEFCAQYLKKGRRVFVEGRLRQENWEGKDGQKRSRISVVAQSVKFMDARPPEGGGGGDGNYAPRPAAAAPQRPASAPAQTRPAPVAPASEPDFPPVSDVPEYDVNDVPYEPGGESPGASDDLPF